MPKPQPVAHGPRYWRLYRTASDNHVVRDYLLGLPVEDYANIRTAMKEVQDRGLRSAKQIKRDIRQIEADGEHGVTYRLLFAVDGHANQMLLGVVAFNKKTQQTPDRYIKLAEDRLRDWRARRERFEEGK
ncbi:MAG: type II toxin-antitoxin system RelE/ParE family toxin [Chloroflexi bacterium]|nr:type II toxin-antitoxin system RelE/ParE family toxin [Chloroflexota bacterium]